VSLYHLVDAYDEEIITEEGGSGGDTTTLSLKIRVVEHFVKDGETTGSTRLKLESQFANHYNLQDERVMAKLREYSFLLYEDGTSIMEHVQDVAPNEAALCEYPCTNLSYKPNTRRRFCWTNATSKQCTDWIDGVQKVDMECSVQSTKVKTFGEGTYAGPPVFVPCKEGGGEERSSSQSKEEEDNGYILSIVYKSETHTSDVVIMDAETLKTLCILELKDHVPYQFHGDFISGYVPEYN